MRVVFLGMSLLMLSINSWASSVLTFANFSQTEGGSGVKWDAATKTFKTITADNKVNGDFYFLSTGVAGSLPPGLAGAAMKATLSVKTVTTATADCVSIPSTAPKNCSQELNTLQNGTTTYFSIDLITPYTFHGHSYTNLLKATFTGALKGTGGGGTASVESDTDTGYTLVYSSDFLDFGDTSSRTMILGLNSLTPAFGVTGGTTTNYPGVTLTSGANINTFQATISGQFGANPKPVSTLIPEPASLMLFGSALLALGCFRRRRLS